MVIERNSKILAKDNQLQTALPKKKFMHILTKTVTHCLLLEKVTNVNRSVFFLKPITQIVLQK